MKKDKYGYEIPDKANKVRKSSENKSGTWRDDKFEMILYDIVDLIEKKYPQDLKMQKTIIIALPNLFAAHLLEKEIDKHERGEMPRYQSVGRHMIELFEGLEVPAEALLEQSKELIDYLKKCPKLMEDEQREELK